MAIGLVGRKCGMTRVFTDDGAAIPVSVVHVDPNRIVQVKTVESDGYRAIQVTTGNVKRSRLSRPQIGHYAKAGVEAGRGLWEFRVDDADSVEYAVGAALTVDRFEEGQYVDVAGVTIGKGFAGVVKRYNFRTQDATHGNSLSHRAPGSIGQNQTPGRVMKGKKMCGHMGNENQTTQNLRVVSVDKDKSLLLIRGAIPGHKGADVVVKPAVKK
ncbi:50S ribosomal protein L3 [Candidatus Methylospira mobilis]|uniref:Large ribosomal subunit protein uL3 n=1 Tax=Candidatus Methylospira mobilis TaxID=1808979 RepID=A0A5Q0BKJ7_9GAMM|nr:50S ribosomal protein L3 [Candidatus Methylospira mobilis]QFY43662.1 50S ribosomal protein L3 [Candidatus Methylospira mobilis]WNV04650.1 50S ribosomal protein L3 [Candidatus Methylospira mobilis]